MRTRAYIKELRHGSLQYDIKNKHTKFEKSSFNIDWVILFQKYHCKKSKFLHSLLIMSSSLVSMMK